MRALAAVALILMAGPALAQTWPVPWDGYWRAPAATCGATVVGAATTGSPA